MRCAKISVEGVYVVVMTTLRHALVVEFGIAS